MRYRFIRGATITGVCVVAFTELVSLGHLLTPTAARIVWIPLLIVACVYSRRKIVLDRARSKFAELDTWDRLCVIAIVGISAVNLFLALLAAPSAWDALSYHAPRISHWIQNKGVAHYPTHIDRQLWISPGHEFFALQLQLITGSNRFINTIQWIASIGCVVTSSLIAKELGALRKGQLFAGLFSATLPMGVAQASGSQTDLFAAFWISASIVLLLRQIKSTRPVKLSDAAMLGACLGLAVLSKGTALVVLSPFVVWSAVCVGSRVRFRMAKPLFVVACFVVAINAGHAIRNYRLYGDLLTNPRNTAVVNEAVTPRILVSNLIRNATLHLYTRSTAVNASIQHSVERLHEMAGVDINDPRSTFFITKYEVKARPRTEGRVGNHFHLLLILVVAVWMIWRRPTRIALLYAGSLLMAYVVFCAVLKWQPWNSRLQLPVFVASAGLVGYALERMLGQRAQHIMAIALVMSAAPILLRNAARPIVSRHAIWTIPREKRYFNETPGMYTQFASAADLLASRECARVGLVTSWVDWEELLWEVMRQRSSHPVQIKHVLFQPDEPSNPAPVPQNDFEPCAIVSLFSSDFLKPRSLGIPAEWELALKERSIEVYLSRER